MLPGPEKVPIAVQNVIYALPCDQLPALSIRLGDVYFKIDPANLILGTLSQLVSTSKDLIDVNSLPIRNAMRNLRPFCLSLIRSVHLPKQRYDIQRDYYVLGRQVMKTWYTIFGSQTPDGTISFARAVS